MGTNGLGGRWALILGASSGFGAAAARALAGAGMNVFGVHLDMKATLPRAQQVVADIRALGRQAVFFNTNAADARKRARVLDQIEETLAGDPAETASIFCCTRWLLAHYVPSSLTARSGAVSAAKAALERHVR